jgi:hypothetical protein
MLRESMQTSGKQVDLSRITGGIDESVDVPHATELGAFAEAVVSRDAARIATARERLRAVLSETAFVDAAAVAGAFHGFVRVADAIGIPYTGAARGQDVPELRDEAGINAFYRISSTSAS